MNRIRILRKERDLSQLALAEALHVHQTAVSQWETGKTKPDTQQAVELALYFGVTTDYLLGVSGNAISEKTATQLGDGLPPDRKQFFDMVVKLNDPQFQMVSDIIDDVLRERA